MTSPPDPSPIPSAAAHAAVRDWSGYFDAVGDAGPRETLLDAADRFDAAGVVDRADPPLAVDLGCGTGRDTLELLGRGLRVLALDGTPEAIVRMLARRELDPYRDSHRLDARVVRFEDTVLPPSLLVSASFTLPFCPPELFDGLWANIVTAIVAGGRFAGQLFGEEDDWAALPDRTHHTRQEVEALFAGFEVESLRTELRGPDPSASHPKRWHVHHVVARRA